MPRYWIIAPYENNETYESVWKFDLEKRCISIGWHEIGDPSKLSHEELVAAVAKAYSTKPPPTHKLIANMVWAFFHEISPGDVIVARQGKSIVAGVGDVGSQPATYTPKRNPSINHPNFIQVTWRAEPAKKQLDTPVFQIRAVVETTKDELDSLGLLEGGGAGGGTRDIEPIVLPSQQDFVLEKYLQDFIVSNWLNLSVFSDLDIYKDEENEGEQYQTEIGRIDILAIDRKSKDFVVIELKKGRPSDQVVGQILRYMGWVKKNLCTNGQSVRGLIICKDKDERLSYSLEMVQSLNIRAKYYKVAFDLRDEA